MFSGFPIGKGSLIVQTSMNPQIQGKLDKWTPTFWIQENKKHAIQKGPLILSSKRDHERVQELHFNEKYRDELHLGSEKGHQS